MVWGTNSQQHQQQPLSQSISLLSTTDSTIDGFSPSSPIPSTASTDPPMVDPPTPNTTTFRPRGFSTKTAVVPTSLVVGIEHYRKKIVDLKDYLHEANEALIKIEEKYNRVVCRRRDIVSEVKLIEYNLGAAEAGLEYLLHAEKNLSN